MKRRKRATTLDDLRERLRTVMETVTEFRQPCSHCSGTGERVATRTLSGNDVAKLSGLPLSSIYSFLGGKSLLFETGMRLLAWIEDQEAREMPAPPAPQTLTAGTSKSPFSLDPPIAGPTSVVLPPEPIDALAELDEDAPAKAIPTVELIPNGNAKVRRAAMQAGIDAALTNRHRPVQFK